MQDQAQRNNKIDRQALRDLARTRIGGLFHRVILYALGTAIGAAFVPAFWAALCLGLIAVAEFAELRLEDWFNAERGAVVVELELSPDQEQWIIDRVVADATRIASG